MSTCIDIELKCGVCRKISKHEVLTSTNEFGSRDLDLRPAEMRRSTMYTWVQVCQHCGYASYDLTKKIKINKEWFKSEEYLSCDNLAFKSYLAKAFYRHYLICVKTNNPQDGHFAALHAAWACDDAGDVENARVCRMKSLEELEKVMAIHGESDEGLLVKADLLRRTEQFDLLIKEFSPIIAKKINEMGVKKRKLENGTIDNESYDNIKSLVDLLLFQDKKAREMDSACYSMRDVFDRPF